MVTEAEGTLLALRRSTEDELGRDLREVGHRLELVLLRRLLRHVEAVDVDGRRRLADRRCRCPRASPGPPRRSRPSPGRRAAEEREQRALELAVEVDVAVLERRVDDLGGADVVLVRDVVALGLERLAVRLRDLRAGEVLRADDERLASGADATPPAVTAPPRGEQDGREQCPRAARIEPGSCRIVLR